MKTDNLTKNELQAIRQRILSIVNPLLKHFEREDFKNNILPTILKDIVPTDTALSIEVDGECLWLSPSDTNEE